MIRPTYVLTLRPEPGVAPTMALKALLKILLRRFGFRVVSVTEEKEPTDGQD